MTEEKLFEFFLAVSLDHNVRFTRSATFLEFWNPCTLFKAEITSDIFGVIRKPGLDWDYTKEYAASIPKKCSNFRATQNACHSFPKSWGEHIRTNAVWSKPECADLLLEFHLGSSIEQLAEKHGRTPTSIKHQLEKSLQKK